MNLYQIDENINQLISLFENGELTEEELNQGLAAMGEITKDKVDNIVSYIKNVNAEVKALKEEEVNLSTRRKAKEKNIDRLKDYVKDYLVRNDIKKLETTRNVISLAKTPGKVKISDLDEFYKWAEGNYKELIKTDISANLTKIKDIVKAGEEIPFVSMETGTGLRIK